MDEEVTLDGSELAGRLRLLGQDQEEQEAEADGGDTCILSKQPEGLLGRA